MGKGFSGLWSGTKGSLLTLDNLQTALDIIGLAPVVGEAADAINAIIYAARGDYVNAGLSVASMIPIAGAVPAGGKLAGKALELGLEFGDEVVDGVKAVTKNADEVGSQLAKHGDDIAKGAGRKVIRKATDADAQSMQNLYNKYNAGQGRNVASTKGKINGEAIELESVSGKIDLSNPTHKGNFITEKDNYYISSNGRLYDSEQKMIEKLRETYKNTPNVNGEIEIISQRPVCDGCHSIIDQFIKDFPNIKVTIVEILTD